MCLSVCKTETAKVKKALKEKKQISVYKSLNRGSQSLTSPSQPFTWQAGENISSRTDGKLTDNEASRGSVDLGFNVSLKKGDASDVRMIGKAADFIAAGGGAAVFSKLTIPQAEWNKALGIRVEKPKAEKKAPAKKAVAKKPAAKKPVAKTVKKLATKKPAAKKPIQKATKAKATKKG